ncbi:hypothetical protein EVAR_33339_1 [Eumeta japonica]|uniref:Uncharacterized protein n=1 Tax=Eumeta variegata TaxID=151549 RepID=A0A4C1YI34_EUMVA|nr:hypothetical protein EVAR_33339_1 [Eumeta japonica]
MRSSATHSLSLCLFLFPLPTSVERLTQQCFHTPSMLLDVLLKDRPEAAVAETNIDTAKKKIIENDKENTSEEVRTVLGIWYELSSEEFACTTEGYQHYSIGWRPKVGNCKLIRGYALAQRLKKYAECVFGTKSSFTTTTRPHYPMSKEIDAAQAERLGRSCLYCSALSPARSAQAERDNESCFFKAGQGTESRARTETYIENGTGVEIDYRIETRIKGVTEIGIKNTTSTRIVNGTFALGLMMEPEGKHRNSIMKQRILAVFGFVEIVLRCTLTMNDFQGLMMQL